MELALLIGTGMWTLLCICVVIWPSHPLILRITRPTRVLFFVVQSRGCVGLRAAWRILTYEEGRRP